MRCAVLGSPIAHSLSPVMHRAAYAELGLDWSFEAVEVGAGGLPTFLSALGDDVRGFAVTAPLKHDAARAAHHRSEVVELLGVANTMLVDDERFTADNTDVPGTVNALAEAGVASVRAARILGGGATAASIAYALSTVGLERLELVVRDRDRAVDTAVVAGGLGLDVTIATLADAPATAVDLLVSTIPVEAVRDRAAAWVDDVPAVFDVVYDPWPTPLADAAGQAGAAVVSGLDLLAHQAALQVALMTGQVVEAGRLRDAALAHLDRR